MNWREKMSSSSLWGIGKNFVGEELAEYKNSWLFSPIVWDVLSEKYCPLDVMTAYGFKKHIYGGDRNLWRKVNNELNESLITSDRVCWELSNQQVFFTRDKQLVADSIRAFAEQNKKLVKEDDGSYLLEAEHILERFNEIAATIEELDENKYPYFVFKNTSVDDAVEYWFSGYDEEKDEYTDKSLRDWDKNITEFVVINDGMIIDFIGNTKFDYNQEQG